MRKTSEMGQQHLEIKAKSHELREIKEENKMLFRNLNSIQDPNVRAYVESEQAQIQQKRAEKQQSQTTTPTSSDSLSQYFTNLGGFGTNLPDY